MRVINRAVLVESCLKSFVIRRLVSVIYNLFLAVGRACRISLAGIAIYSVVYITFLK